MIFFYFSLVTPINTFNPISIQFRYCQKMIENFIRTNGIHERFKILFFGPGYDKTITGCPRLGCPEKIKPADRNGRFTSSQSNSKVSIFLFIISIYNYSENVRLKNLVFGQHFYFWHKFWFLG